MDKDIKEFIEKNITLIDSNDFATFYRRLAVANRTTMLRAESTAEITQILLNAKINPLDHMKFIPSHYLAYSDISEIFIPEHIVTIGEGAFSGCENLDRIVLPPNVSIEKGAFFKCDNLKTIIFKGRIPRIAEGAFAYCNAVKEIFYSGTKREYKMISFKNKLVTINFNAVIHCVDGDIYMEQGQEKLYE